MVELVDTTDLKSVGLARAGSSPVSGTNKKEAKMFKYYLIYLLMVFLICLPFLKVTVNGHSANSFISRLIGAFAFTLIFGNIVGLPILGIICLIMK